MLRRVLAVVAVLLAAGIVRGQDTPRLYTRPTVPPREVLDRLNLKLAWRTYVATDGARDGLKTVQLLGDDILVLTRSGIVSLLDASTGQARWRVSTGNAYPTVSGVGANSRMIFAVNGTMLTVFDRINGRMLWEWEVPGPSISAPPVADEKQLYLTMANNRMAVYLFPRFLDLGTPKKEEKKDEKKEGGKKEEKKEGEKKEEPKDKPKPPDQPAGPVLGGTKPDIPTQDKSATTQPSFYGGTGSRLVSIGPLSGTRDASRNLASNMDDYFLFDYPCGSSIAYAPVLGDQDVLYAGSNGLIFTVSKKVGRSFSDPIYTGGPIFAPPAVYGEIAYVAGGDDVLYAVKMGTTRRQWRFTKGATILNRPAVTDDSVFVSGNRAGLWRLERESGAEVWENRDADRFLATNAKFVYALDRSGRLMVLDRKRGTKLSGYDTRDFVVPIINDETDRIYLASNDGLLVCLHDKDYPSPLTMKTASVVVEVGPGGKPGGKPGAGVDVGPGKPGDKPKDGVDVGPGDKPGDKPKDGVDVGPGGKPKEKPKDGVGVGPDDKPKEKPKDGVGVGGGDKPKEKKDP